MCACINVVICTFVFETQVDARLSAVDEAMYKEHRRKSINLEGVWRIWSDSMRYLYLPSSLRI